MKRALCLAACLSFAVGVAAQARPDFSGRWTSDPGPAPTPPVPGAQAGTPRPAGDMGSGWGTTITIAQGASQLTVEYAFFARGDLQPPLRFVYALDGSETGNAVMMGRGTQRQTSKTVWQGDKLVIMTVHTVADPTPGNPVTSNVQQMLSLESPTSLIVETTRSGVLGGGASTTRTVFRKIQS